MLVCSKALHVCAWLNICYKLLTGPMCYCHPWYSDGKMCDTHQNIHLTGTHTDTHVKYTSILLTEDTENSIHIKIKLNPYDWNYTCCSLHFPHAVQYMVNKMKKGSRIKHILICAIHVHYQACVNQKAWLNRLKLVHQKKLYF